MKLLPMLFDKGERNFTTEGLGRLSDAISCIVTDTRNSDTEYEVVLTYPIGGVLYDYIEIDMVIGCLAHKHDTEIEAFRIYQIEDDMSSGTATIYARQVAIMLAEQTAISKFKIENGNASAAMANLRTNYAWYNNFQWLTMSSDITETATLAVHTPQKLIEFLISDVENGLLANYGGEYSFHRYNIELLQSRGADNGGVVRYGKNMTSLKRIRDASNVVTSIFPYCAKEDDSGNYYVAAGNNESGGLIFHAPDYDTYYPHIEILDCTGDILAPEGASSAWVPSSDYINEYAEAYLDLNITGEIPVTYQATVVDDPESNDIELHICDTVLLQHPAMGINVKAKITKTVYNVLSDQWESLEIGTVRSNLSGTLYDMFNRKPSITRIQTGGGTSGTEGDWTWSIDGSIAKLSYSKEMQVNITTSVGSYRRSPEITIELPTYFASGWTANTTSLQMSFTPTNTSIVVTPYVSSYQNGVIKLYLISYTSQTGVKGNLHGSAIMIKST